MGEVIDARMRLLGKALKDRFAMEGDDEWENACYQAQVDGESSAGAYVDPLGAQLSGQLVALGALRYVFENDGADALKEALSELQSAADEWSKPGVEEPEEG